MWLGTHEVSCLHVSLTLSSRILLLRYCSRASANPSWSNCAETNTPGSIRVNTVQSLLANKDSSLPMSHMDTSRVVTGIAPQLVMCTCLSDRRLPQTRQREASWARPRLEIVRGALTNPRVETISRRAEAPPPSNCFKRDLRTPTPTHAHTPGGCWWRRSSRPRRPTC